MRKKAIKVVKYVAFLLAFLFVFLLFIEPLSRLFTPKTEVGRDNNYRKICYSYRAEAENSLDIFVVGNSDAYRCFVPNVLFKEKGYTSSVSGMGRQTSAGVLSIVKEMFREQSPKVVLLETDFLFKTKNDKIVSKLMSGGKKESLFRRVMMKGTQNFDDISISSMAYLFPVFKYHTRWKDLTKNDFLPDEVYRSEFKGYVLSTVVNEYPYDFGYMSDKSGADATMTAENEKKLGEILDVIKQNDCKVVFFTAPSAQSWSKAKHDKIEQIAKANNADYIDFNIEGTLKDFSWKTDTQDAGDHMNANGAIKITRYMADYLDENFSFADKRNDENYREWSDDCKVFDEALKKGTKR